MRWPLVAVILLAGCATTVQDAPGPTPPERVLPAGIDLTGSFSAQTEGFGDGQCPTAGDCVVHDIHLQEPTTMQVDVRVEEGSLQWGLWRGDDQLMYEAVSSDWRFERHLAAGDYRLALHSAGFLPTEVAGELSWHHAFPPGGEAHAPEEIHDEGTWAAGQVDVYLQGDCLTCQVYRFNVTGSGYGTVAMSAHVTWGDASAWAGLRLLQDGHVVAAATAGIPSQERALDAELFPGSYELELSANALQERPWSLRVRFD